MLARRIESALSRSPFAAIVAEESLAWHPVIAEIAAATGRSAVI
jgi:hypothetical protein